MAVAPVVLLDLDGVVWLAHRPIPGSVEAIAALRERGVRVLFVTNNSAATDAQQHEALAAIGVPAEGDVLTSARAAAGLVAPGERVLVCGGPGVVAALEQRGAVPVPNTEAEAGAAAPVPDVVMVGFHRTFDYESLRRAATAVRRGARFVATNDDATYPTPEGPIPGGGAIVAAVRTAAGREPVIAGKPHEAMAALVRTMVGPQAAAAAVMVGDRPSTDGAFARRLGCRFALVHSGVTAPGSAVAPAPDYEAPDLQAIVAQLLA